MRKLGFVFVAVGRFSDKLSEKKAELVARPSFYFKDTANISKTVLLNETTLYDCLHAIHISAQFFTNYLNRVIANMSIDGY